MAEPNPPGPAPKPEVGYKPPGQGNPALRMMGIRLPKKLPSRNWLIFLSITGSLSAAIIYDRREKDRATLRWAKSIAHLANEPLPNASQLPRKLTVYLEAPPGDSLRISQEHYKEYVKPVLATSGLDWEFVQGREEGDIRAAVAERIRRARKREQGEVLVPTDADITDEMRRKADMPEYEGVLGDIVIGRHTWKEYIRGQHEGWLGPLDLPSQSATPATQELEDDPPVIPVVHKVDDDSTEGSDKEQVPEEEKKPEEEAPSRPKQPPPFNRLEDYEAAELPSLLPHELTPATVIPFPFMLGFLRTPKRIWRYIHRREMADEIGREVAAAVLATYREFRELPQEDGSHQHEQQAELDKEEECWVKSVWKENTKEGQVDDLSKEKIWAKPIAIDSRIAMRMRRFQIEPEDEERAKRMVVKEEEIEGWIKGSIRSVWRWGAESFSRKEEKPPIPLDDE